MLKDKILSLFNCIPLQNTIIFEASPDLTDSPYYFFKYLVEHYEIQKKYKLVWFIRDNRNVSRTSLLGAPIVCVNNDSKQKDLRTRLQRLYYNYTAKAIIDSNMYVYKKRPGQVRILMYHGMPIKECVEYQQDVGDVDLLTISGDFFRKVYLKYVPADRIRSYGLPRDEALYDLSRGDVTEKKIVWMPTFRQHKNKDGQPVNQFPLGIPVIKTQEELALVNEALRKNHVTLMLRMHPAQDISVLRVAPMSNIVFADNDYLHRHGMMLEDLLADSDALITDYSSVYYDYLFTGNPIGLTFEDVKVYQQTMNLIYDDIEHELPGFQMLQVPELIRFIEDVHNGCDPCRAERDAFMKRLGMEKFPCCRLLGEFLMEKLEG